MSLCTRCEEEIKTLTEKEKRGYVGDCVKCGKELYRGSVPRYEFLRRDCINLESEDKVCAECYLKPCPWGCEMEITDGKAFHKGCNPVTWEEHDCPLAMFECVPWGHDLTWWNNRKNGAK